MSAGNETSARRARMLELQPKALELRRAGKNYGEIAAMLDIGKTSAHRMVKAGLAEAAAQVEAQAGELIALELSRLDAMLAGLWPSARQGGLGAIDRVLKIMERRAKLLGLDAPVKVAQTTPEGDAQDPARYVVMVPPAVPIDEWTATYGPTGTLQ